MSGLDLKSVLFLTPEEVALLFRKQTRDYKVDAKGNLVGVPGDPDVAWVYRARNGLLKSAAKYLGPKNLLFLKAEVERIIEEAPSDSPPKT